MSFSTDNADTVRIDKWLWAARFYKTRMLAGKAITGGRVHVNGQRVKAARGLRPGDEVVISKGPYKFIVTVDGLSERRGSADQARSLYSESDASIAARELLREQRRINAALTGGPARKPDKKSRRQIRQFIRGD